MTNIYRVSKTWSEQETIIRVVKGKDRNNYRPTGFDLRLARNPEGVFGMTSRTLTKQPNIREDDIRRKKLMTPCATHIVKPPPTYRKALPDRRRTIPMASAELDIGRTKADNIIKANIGLFVRDKTAGSKGRPGLRIRNPEDDNNPPK